MRKSVFPFPLEAIPKPCGSGRQSAQAGRNLERTHVRCYGFERVALVLVLLLALLNSSAARADVIVSEDSEWRYYKGVAEASSPVAAWRQSDFNDAAWATGRGPFFYEDSFGYTGNTALTDMRGRYTCVFLRKAFSVATPADVGDLTLYLQTDDGCVVWLNGAEVARVNMPDGEPLVSWTSLPAAGEPNVTNVILSNAESLLRAGTNILAIQAFNSGLSDSSDFLIAASLSGNLDIVPPAVDLVVPAPGSVVRTLTGLEVLFSENVTGVDAADLRINGAPATGLSVISPRNYVFTFAQPPTGAASVAWAANPGITDLAGNPLVVSSWWYQLDPNAPAADIILSEFLAQNDNGIRDNFGSRSDWIELLNRSAVPADLDGYFLTDNPAKLTKWRFPAVTLDAGKFLIVWASERNQTNPLAPLHTNFKLSAGGDYLALVDPQTNVISEFAPKYPPQRSDISYGRDQTSPSLVGYYATPTPGAANSSSGAGFAPEPVFSVAGGLYTNASLTVTLSAASGVIRYTTDGTRPTTNSSVYSSPIIITGSRVIQARVFQEGLLPSAIVVHTYNLLGGSAAGFNSNLPLLIVNTSGRGIAQEARTLATVTAIEPFRGRASLATPPAFQGNCQIEVRGQSSTMFPKLGYNLEINDANGNDLEVPLLGLPSESDWVLYAPYSDKPFLQNFLAYELHEQMGHYSPRRRFVEVFLDTTGGKLEYPGDYMGIYILLEKIKVDKNRVNLARLSAEQNAEPEISGGYMIKKDKDSPGDYNFSTQGGSGFSAQALKLHEPKPREATLPQKAWIRNYLVEFEKTLYAANWLTATGTNHYSHYIDADSFVDHHWIVEFPKQIDGYRLSNYMSKDRGGKLRMEPIWDWNLSFGNADYLDGANATGWYYTQCDENSHIWLRRLICGTTASSGTTGDPDFNQKIADRWSVLRTNILSSTNLLLRIDELAAYLDEAQVRDFAKWPRLGTYVWPNPPLYSTPTTYAGIIANMKNWVRNRFTWIDGQFLKTPQFSHPDSGVSPGFALTMSAPAGLIYYTTDGTDPRASGGGLSAQARVYSAGVVIQTNSRVVARARSGNRWSGPAAATFTVEVPPLVLTELMFSPARTAGSTTNDAAQFEYLELQNAGPQTLDLRGFRFTQGIQFDFTTGGVTSLAPGERIVVAHDPAALVSRHGAIAKLVGPFDGSLANEGERITLVGPMQETVFTFSYDSEWYPATDGLGFALVPVTEGQPTAAFAQAGGWRGGSVLGGTPGLAEPAAPVLPRVVINEVLTHTDPPLAGTIELLNCGDTEADIGGWFLSDDRLTPKYRIPLGTRLPPGACLVLTETNFNPNPGVPPSFDLRASGDEAYLYSADAAGRLTGYCQGYKYGAALLGVSFGRHVTSTGEEHFVAQAARSLGQTNGPPRVGPVVITEIHYHPPDVFTNNAYWDNTEDEFIELCNISDITVNLFDPEAPTNVWRLRDAVSYTFPTNQTMNPGARLLVVSFDPVADPASAAAFRNRFGLSGSVRLLGPFRGKLSNGSDSVELIQPDTVRFYATNVVTTSVLVDKVRYRDDAPWPAGADGLGFSLQRRTESAYGNDPTNWVAALPTPAAPLSAGAAPTILTAPASQTVLPGTTLVLGVEATGPPPLQYQWRHDGDNLVGATSQVLTLTNVQPTQSGAYCVVVSSPSRATASAAAVVKVGTPPALLQSPLSAEAWPAQTVAFSVIAQGLSPLQYQWRRNGAALAAAVRPTLQLLDVDAQAEGDYDVVVLDGAGLASTSAVASLTLLGKPFIVQHPVRLTVAPGATATFQIAVTNTAALPITYEWRKEGLPVATHTTDSPADSFILTNAQPTDAGEYSVRVHNRAVLAPGFTSAAAGLTVDATLDTDGDGMPDVFESRHGLNPRDPSDAAADADGDGASNLEEYLAGTDPRDPASVFKLETHRAAGPITIRFQCLKSRSYTLLWRDTVAGSPWNTLTNIAAVAGAGEQTRVIEVVDPQAAGKPQRYYRLQTPARPGE